MAYKHFKPWQNLIQSLISEEFYLSLENNTYDEELESDLMFPRNSIS
jgi:hypothetical protein